MSAEDKPNLGFADIRLILPEIISLKWRRFLILAAAKKPP
jgi:hypothetical protein